MKAKIVGGVMVATKEYNMESIASCPFCGNKASTYQAEPMHSIQKEGWYVRCNVCSAELGCNVSRNGELIGEFASEAEAIMAWNKRYVNPADLLNHYAW